MIQVHRLEHHVLHIPFHILWFQSGLLKGSEVKEWLMCRLKSLLNVVDKRYRNDIFQHT